MYALLVRHDHIELPVAVDVVHHELRADAAVVVDDHRRELGHSVAIALHLQPVDHRRLIRTGFALAVAPPALAGDEVGLAVAVDVLEVCGVRLGHQVLEQFLLLERGVSVLVRPAVLLPPDAEAVGRRVEHVHLAVVVHIEGVHVGTGVADAVRVELPRCLRIHLRRLFPPAAHGHHVQFLVAVPIADAQAVAVLERTGDHLAGVRHHFAILDFRIGRGFGDRRHDPQGRGVLLVRCEVAHLADVIVRLEFLGQALGLGLRAHEQALLPVAQQVHVQRGLVAGRVPDNVLLPMAGLTLWVLQPVHRGTGEIDHDEVGEHVAVEVFRPAGEDLAVAAEAVAVVAGLLHLVGFPVRCFVPELADEDVHLAVLVDVGNGHAFGPELGIDDGLLPTDGRLLGEAKRRSTEKQDQGRESHGRGSNRWEWRWYCKSGVPGKQIGGEPEV